MLFIKLSFQETYLNVAGSWSGLMLCMRSQPEIVESLPRNIRENKKVNMKLLNSKESRYDYYLACTGNYANVKETLDNFMNQFAGDVPAIIQRESNQHHNPIITKLNRLINNEMPPFFQSHSLFRLHTKIHSQLSDEVESEIEGREVLMNRMVM